MKHFIYFTTIVCIFFFCSCETTKVYVKTSQYLYEDNFLVEERSSVTQLNYKEKDGKKIEEKKDKGSSSKHYYNIPDNSVEISNDGISSVIHTIIAEKEIKSKASVENEEVVFYLYETKTDNEEITNHLLGKKKMVIKNGEIVMSSSQKDKVQFSGANFKDKDAELFETVSQNVINQIKNENYNNEKASNKKRTENYTEKITVISSPNSSYITYSVLGKPFVIIGSFAWNILKCAGYAFLNFGGGYNFITGNSEDSLWILPSFSDSKEKAVRAREANRIQYYPEYHIPFTNNKIIVDKYDRNIEVERLVDEVAEQITAIEHQEYDNTMSVSLSAKADAASTVSTANLIGTGVTIPVSVVTWVGGVAYGIYEQFGH